MWCGELLFCIVSAVPKLTGPSPADRFVDRDLMMRFLGWGVGHLNQADFPHEANALLASEKDRQLHVPINTSGEPGTSHGHGVVSEGELEELEDEFDIEDELEEDLDGGDELDDGVEPEMVFEY